LIRYPSYINSTPTLL